jgi:catechol 2,3-dioxygenase-like lactoylglutathione lyase family enzyme
MFKVHKTQHVLAVDDFEGCLAYFIDKLGFTELSRVEGWSFLALDTFYLMVGDCRGEILAEDTYSHSFFAYVNCEGIDELYEEYRGRGVEFRERIANKPWGLREFVVASPEGHRIKFGQALNT